MEGCGWLYAYFHKNDLNCKKKKLCKMSNPSFPSSPLYTSLMDPVIPFFIHNIYFTNYPFSCTAQLHSMTNSNTIDATSITSVACASQQKDRYILPYASK